MRRAITLILLLIASRGFCDDKITDDEIISSPRKTFKIVQHGDENWTETLQFADRHCSPIVLEEGIPWPARFFISPDDQWILRIQKSGSGDNISFLYHFDANHRLWRMEEQIGQLGFDYLARTAGISLKDLYHTGIEFTAWDPKAGVLHFNIHASSLVEGRRAFNRPLTYKLNEHTIGSP
jgi:hypothetical protein